MKEQLLKLEFAWEWNIHHTQSSYCPGGAYNLSVNNYDANIRHRHSEQAYSTASLRSNYNSTLAEKAVYSLTGSFATANGSATAS